jgi:hypothetical protein
MILGYFIKSTPENHMDVLHWFERIVESNWIRDFLRIHRESMSRDFRNCLSKYMPKSWVYIYINWIWTAEDWRAEGPVYS